MYIKQGLVPTKFIPNIDFADEPVIHCYVQVIENTFLFVGDTYK